MVTKEMSFQLSLENCLGISIWIEVEVEER